MRKTNFACHLSKICNIKGGYEKPFDEINVKNEIEKQKQDDPEFRKAWEDSRAEYRLIGEMISLRKQEKITQKNSLINRK